jgi:hypothetical protein
MDLNSRRATAWLGPVCILLLAVAASMKGTVGPEALSAAQPVASDRNFLQVSPSGRYFTYLDGTPFFWLADTAWGIAGLTPQEAEMYFADRRSKGFNVIQINALIYLWTTRGWNGGMPAFQRNNPDLPNETFWSYLDWLVVRAKAYGLHLAIALGWGPDYPTLFGNDTAKAIRFGRWVGLRYRNHSNIVWIVAGEYDLNRTTNWSVYDAVAQGLLEGDGQHLLTIHPSIPSGTPKGVQSSSLHWHTRPWLSFNMLQSGHVDDLRSAGMTENYQMVDHDYPLRPTKPVLDAEPAYEDAPDGIWLGWNSSSRMGADVMRRKAYWSVFAGASGHTYGHNDVYRFWKPGDPVTSLSRNNWVDSLQAPGAHQMRYLKALMEIRSFERVPDQALLASSPGTGTAYVRATRAASGRDALIYIPAGNDVTINMDRLAGSAQATWFNPRTGNYSRIGVLTNRGTRTFNPPGDPAVGNDWVLVLDGL